MEFVELQNLRVGKDFRSHQPGAASWVHGHLESVYTFLWWSLSPPFSVFTPSSLCWAHRWLLPTSPIILVDRGNSQFFLFSFQIQANISVPFTLLPISGLLELLGTHLISFPYNTILGQPICFAKRPLAWMSLVLATSTQRSWFPSFH